MYNSCSLLLFLYGLGMSAFLQVLDRGSYPILGSLGGVPPQCGLCCGECVLGIDEKTNGFSHQ